MKRSFCRFIFSLASVTPDESLGAMKLPVLSSGNSVSHHRRQTLSTHEVTIMFATEFLF
jgi:hypothetical protein